MAQCRNSIFKNIESTCENRVSANIEQTVYLFNRSEIENIQKDVVNGETVYNKVVSFDMATGKTGFTAKGFKKNLTASFERTVSDDTVDTWSNSITLTGYEFDALSAQNFDSMGDLVAVIDRKGTKTADGSFIVFGLENGLFVSSDSWASGDNNGARTITLSSLSDSGESVSYYVLSVYNDESPAVQTYQATKAFLESKLA